MKCPKCGGANAAVYDSRPSLGGIRRRRHCPDCGYKFKSFEAIVPDDYGLVRNKKQSHTKMAEKAADIEIEEKENESNA